MLQQLNHHNMSTRTRRPRNECRLTLAWASCLHSWKKSFETRCIKNLAAQPLIKPSTGVSRVPGQYNLLRMPGNMRSRSGINWGYDGPCGGAQAPTRNLHTNTVLVSTHNPTGGHRTPTSTKPIAPSNLRLVPQLWLLKNACNFNTDPLLSTTG